MNLNHIVQIGGTLAAGAIIAGLALYITHKQDQMMTGLLHDVVSDVHDGSCRQMRGHAFQHARIALAEQPEQIDWDAVITYAANNRYAKPCTQCPACWKPYHLNPDREAWAAAESADGIVVCPGPHSGDDGPTLRGVPTRPDWWPGIIMNEPNPSPSPQGASL